MGGICQKKEKEPGQGSVHPTIKENNMRDEEAEKMVNQSDSRPLMNKNDGLDGKEAQRSQNQGKTITDQPKKLPDQPKPAVDPKTLKQDLRPPERKDTSPPVKVVSQYQIQENQVDAATKQRYEEAQKKAEAEQHAALGQISEAKKDKVNQLDDFSTRWKEELDRRGVSSEKKTYDATSLTNHLNSSLSPTLKNELAVVPNPAAEQGNKGPSVDALRTDYILQVDVQQFLKMFNDLRTSPKTYSEIIRTKYLNMLDPFFCHKLTLRNYEEGKTAIDEAVRALETQKALSGLSLDPGLCVAAHIQAKRQAYEKKVFSEDRASQMAENVKRFVNVPQGCPLADCNVSVQNLNYEDVLINLFIGDGDVSRRNRTAMAKEDFSKCGFGIFQRTKKSQIFCTLILTGKAAQTDKSKIPKDLLQDAGASQLS